MINVIIPAYNAHKTIDLAIASLAIQTIADKLDVLIINDASEKDYSETIAKFSNMINIKEIKHEKNLGVGFARQTGLEAVTHEFFAFMDSDDVFLTALAFEKMYAHMLTNPETVLISSSFLEQLEDGTYSQKDESMYWTFSKIYRTSYIRKNNISFPPQNQNEDNIFNMNIRMCLDQNENIANGKEPLYIWKFQPNSITRKNNFEYWFHTDVIGVLKGFYHIIENPNVKPEKYIHDATNFLMIAYFRYIDSKKYRPAEKWNREILKEIRSFYNKIILPLNVNFTDSLIQEIMQSVVKEHQKEYINILKFRDFLKGLTI